jgi:glucosyl-3-phosphoglycerate synthase
MDEGQPEILLAYPVNDVTGREEFTTQHSGPTDLLTHRTFHHSQFERVDELAAAKCRAGLTVSACVPTRNEGATIGRVVSTIRAALMEDTNLVDELVVIDADSTDDTVSRARDEGATVVAEADVLPGEKLRRGKGEALWKSLHICTGDLMCWVDADIVNFYPRFVTGVLGPLLTDQSIGYVKGFYERPLRLADSTHPAGGGRVTELLARPLLNSLWPHLASVIQPLSGEFAGRREVMEQVAFYSGYGVELGLLIEIARKFGTGAIAQVDLESRIHRHQDLYALSQMSFTILQTALAELREEGRLMDGSCSKVLAQFDLQANRRLPALAELDAIRYPPMVTVEAYQKRH